jgi:DNA-directed RNA polymerase subunit RPC12/RpoP
MRVACPRCGTPNLIEERDQAADGRVRTRCTDCDAKLLIKVNRPDLRVADDIPATPEGADADLGLATERLAPLSELEIDLGDEGERERDTWHVLVVHELADDRVGDLRRALLGLPRFRRNPNKMQDVTAELPYVIPDLNPEGLAQLKGLLVDAGARWETGSRHALLTPGGDLRSAVEAAAIEEDAGGDAADEGLLVVGDDGDLADDGPLVSGDDDPAAAEPLGADDELVVPGGEDPDDALAELLVPGDEDPDDHEPSAGSDELLLPGDEDPDDERRAHAGDGGAGGAEHEAADPAPAPQEATVPAERAAPREGAPSAPEPEAAEEMIVVDEEDDATDAAAEALFGPAVTHEKLAAVRGPAPRRPGDVPLSTLTAPIVGAGALGYVSAMVVLSNRDLGTAADEAIGRALTQVRAGLVRAAQERGGDAVWGMRTTHGAVGGSWMVLAEGTAVRTR